MKKFRLGMIMAVFAFIAMLPLRVTAANTDKEVGVTCTPANEDKTEYAIEMCIPNAAKEGITTLSLKLDVNVGSASGNGFNDPVVTFSEDVTSKARVYETRYHSTLNIYIAGVEPLFGEGDTLNVGTVAMTTVSGEAVALSGVSLSEDADALMVVRGWGDAEAVTVENLVKNPDDPGGSEIPDDPDAESKSEFTMPESDEISLSKESAALIERSVLTYIKDNYAEVLNEAGPEYKIVSRLDLTGLSEADVPQDVKDAFAARLNGMTVGQYYDISIYAEILGNDGNALETGIRIPQLEGMIDLSLKIPETLRKGGRTYKMFHCKDDLMAEGLASRVKDDTITFSTDSFSPYALAYTDNAAGNGSNNGTNNSGTNGTSGNRATSAKTGDNANVMLYLILAAASLAGGVTVYTKKKKSYR